jgi:toxoflavin synthase
MVKSVHQNLTRGGEFFAWTVNPDYSFEGVNSTKYGATNTLVRLFDGGREVLCEVHADLPVAFTNYMLTRGGYERALLDVGFREFSWAEISIPDDAIAQFPPGYWDDLLANPPFVGLYAR